MARTVSLSWQGQELHLPFSKVDRRRLYGWRQRLALDPEGRPCRAADLTADGALVLLPGMSAQSHYDMSGIWYPNDSLVPMLPDGTIVDRVSSTLGVAQSVEPVEPEALLDLQVSSVYQLDPPPEADDLVTALRGGTLLRLPFSYRGGAEPDQAILVGNDEGIFAIVGRPVSPEWCLLEDVAPPVLDDEEDDGDLDFDFF